ncbi:MAG TPA: amino acid racemase [Pyrinomonadaceae bacterium]
MSKVKMASSLVQHPDDVLGVVGGMGPLASTEFLKTIYEQGSWEREQEAPRVVVYSDPTFIDRTEAFRNGHDAQLLEQLITALTRLRAIGASHIVICCVTIHYLLPRVPHELQSQLLSLIDVIYDELTATNEPHLLLCTSATREMGIFEKHKLWTQTRGRFVLPNDSDQREIHRMIYTIKQSQDVRQQIPFVKDLLAKYHVNAFIAGCTEIHLLSRHFATNRRCIDPLMSIARELTNRSVKSAAAH